MRSKRGPNCISAGLASILTWGLALPLFSIALSFFTSGLSLFLLLLYPVVWARIAWCRRRHGGSAKDSHVYATFCVLGKAAEATGILRFVWSRLILRRQGQIIEYKQATFANDSASSG